MKKIIVLLLSIFMLHAQDFSECEYNGDFCVLVDGDLSSKKMIHKSFIKDDKVLYDFSITVNEDHDINVFSFEYDLYSMDKMKVKDILLKDQDGNEYNISFSNVNTKQLEDGAFFERLTYIIVMESRGRRFQNDTGLMDFLKNANKITLTILGKDNNLNADFSDSDLDATKASIDKFENLNRGK